MNRKFVAFFVLVGLTGVFSILNSWIIQRQVHGGISVSRSIFEVALLLFVLYLLSQRSIPSYALSLVYIVGNAVLYGFELAQFYAAGNQSAALPAGAIVASVLLIISTISALAVLAADYVEYRRR